MGVSSHTKEAVACLRQGGIIAYPTEAVYGLGCDPDAPAALVKLMAAKGRQSDKGFILIASDFKQLEPYIAVLPNALKQQILQTWPGPVTWLVKANPKVSSVLTGGRSTLAIRVTAHRLAAELCHTFGKPIVSTSANLSGMQPLRDAAAVSNNFGEKIDYLVHGELGKETQPTMIIDAETGARLR